MADTIFNLSIAMDGAAFDDDPSTEVARILLKLAEQIGDSRTLDTVVGQAMRLRDRNGNTVGGWSAKDREPLDRVRDFVQSYPGRRGLDPEYVYGLDGGIAAGGSELTITDLRELIFTLDAR